MNVVSIYENDNLCVEESLLDDLGEIYVAKDLNRLVMTYRKHVDVTIFDYTFEEFLKYMYWTIHKRKKTMQKKHKLPHK